MNLAVAIGATEPVATRALGYQPEALLPPALFYYVDGVDATRILEEPLE
jgi:hypothetical protein